MSTYSSESTQAFGFGASGGAERTAVLGGDRTGAFGAAGGGSPERTQAMTLAPCPICSTTNPPGETYCGECGFLLGSTPGDETSAPTRALPKLVDRSGREWALQAGENIVGREGADILLPDRTVSRRHARVVVDESSVWVEDLGSTNGSKVSGDALSAGRKASLADGTSVQFGSVQLTAVIPAGSLRTLLALPSAAAPAASAASSDAPPLLALEGAGGANSAARVVWASGVAVTLTSARTTFGRRATNDVVIDDDPTISGTHAEIYAEEGEFFVVDAGSTNGTKLNGRSLTPKASEVLHDGDTITMGRTDLTFAAPNGTGKVG